MSLFKHGSLPETTVKNIVLVHGAFVDGSGWEGVYKILKARGYTVSVAQIPCTSMEEDVATVNRILDKQDGPVILVGHSYGGAVITMAGVHSKVVGLVYLAAFQPDAGESALSLVMSAPDLSSGAVLPPDANGFIFFNPVKFHAEFCAELPAALAEFMSISQIPVAAKAFGAPMTQVAWKEKPCWAIITESDHAINVEIQRRIYKRSGTKAIEIKGACHTVYVCHPKESAEVIETAAKNANLVMA